MMKHIKSIDIVRSLSMLYILIFHCGNYTCALNFQPWGDFVKNAALGAFMFISGYLLSRKYLDTSSPLLMKQFWFSRIIRIMPLFIMSLSIYVIMGYLPLDTALLSLSGLSTFIPPQPPTLWFVSLLIIFYYIFPVFHSRSLSAMLIIAIGILVGSFVLQYMGIPIDRRFCYYFPCFSAGIILSKYSIDKFSGIGFLGCTIILFLLLCCCYLNWDFFDKSLGNSIFRMLMAFVGAISLIIISNYLNIYLRFAMWMSRIAYASMAAYLFHRQIISAIRQYLYWPEDGVKRIIFLMFVCIPVILLVGYGIQYCYDRIMKRVISSQKV